MRFFETLQKDFILNVFFKIKSFCRVSKNLTYNVRLGFPVSNTSTSITLKTFLKHTHQRQTASLLLLCKQGNFFNLFFQ